MQKTACPEKQRFLNYTINDFFLNVDVTMEVCFMASSILMFYCISAALAYKRWLMLKYLECSEF